MLGSSPDNYQPNKIDSTSPHESEIEEINELIEEINIFADNMIDFNIDAIGAAEENLGQFLIHVNYISDPQLKTLTNQLKNIMEKISTTKNTLAEQFVLTVPLIEKINQHLSMKKMLAENKINQTEKIENIQNIVQHTCKAYQKTWNAYTNRIQIFYSPGQIDDHLIKTHTSKLRSIIVTALDLLKNSHPNQQTSTIIHIALNEKKQLNKKHLLISIGNQECSIDTNIVHRFSIDNTNETVPPTHSYLNQQDLSCLCKNTEPYQNAQITIKQTKNHQIGFDIQIPFENL